MKQTVFSVYARAKMLSWSRILFIATLILFVAETSYIAINSAFPMAYDESYHVGLIQFFTEHLNPVIAQQHPSTFGFGNIVHNPSWLYHWLLSFPDRLFALSGSLRVEVVGLRFINIAIAVGSLFVLRRLLGQFGLSNALKTFVVFLVALTPTFAILASQVNYDNLVVLATLAATSVTLSAVKQLRAGKPSALTFSGLLLILLFGSLIKFSFVPIALGVTIVMIVALVRAPHKLAKQWSKLETDFQSIRPWLQMVLLTAIIAGMSLFSLFYVQNIVRYHNPSPSCEKVLNVDACSNYYAWERNYTLAQSRGEVGALESPLVYTYHWLVTCWYQLYGVIRPWGGIVHISKPFYGFLLLVTGVATLVTISRIRKLFRSYPQLYITTVIALTYVLVLWSRNFNDYRHLGEAVAVQGRYIMPILAHFYLVLVLGVLVAIPSGVRWQRVKFAVTSLIVIVLLTYGGTTLYARSILPDYNWQNTNLQL